MFPLYCLGDAGVEDLQRGAQAVIGLGAIELPQPCERLVVDDPFRHLIAPECLDALGDDLLELIRGRKPRDIDPRLRPPGVVSWYSGIAR